MSLLYYVFTCQTFMLPFSLTIRDFCMFKIIHNPNFFFFYFIPPFKIYHGFQTLCHLNWTKWSSRNELSDSLSLSAAPRPKLFWSLERPTVGEAQPLSLSYCPTVRETGILSSTVERTGRCLALGRMQSRGGGVSLGKWGLPASWQNGQCSS